MKIKKKLSCGHVQINSRNQVWINQSGVKNTVVDAQKLNCALKI